MSVENQEEQKVPTKDEVVAFYQEQIEVKTLQVKLQRLNAKFQQARADELQALAFIAQMTAAPSEDEEPAPKKLKKDGSI
jgi:peptide deformylase